MIDLNRLTKPLFLGNQGENGARTLEIDVSAWLEMWPEAQIEMLMQRPGEDEVFIVENKEIKDGVIYFTPGSADTALAGVGKIMIYVKLGEKIAKSLIGSTMVLKSLDRSSDPPEASEAWVNKVLEAADNAKESEEKAKHYAERTDQAEQYAIRAEEAKDISVSAAEKAAAAAAVIDRAEEVTKAAEEATEKAESAAEQAESATNDALEAAKGIAFMTFDIDSDGYLNLNNPYSNFSFEVTDGYLEVVS